MRKTLKETLEDGKRRIDAVKGQGTAAKLIGKDAGTLIDQIVLLAPHLRAAEGKDDPEFSRRAVRPTLPPYASGFLPKAVRAATRIAQLPEVLGNESWRPAVTNWRSKKISSDQLEPCTRAPGVDIDESLEDFGPGADMSKRDSYLTSRIERLCFEIKRCGGDTMKPLARKPVTKRFLWHEDHYAMWSFAQSLQNHLGALLESHPDQKLAAAVRRANLPDNKRP